MPHITRIQRLSLQAANRSPSGYYCPRHPGQKVNGQIRMSLNKLVMLGLMEHAIMDDKSGWRITDAGKQAIVHYGV